MSTKVQKPGLFWAYVAVATGILLIFAGLTASAGYLGLPLLLQGDVLGAQLGQTAAIFLGLICGSLAVVHGVGAIMRKSSRSLVLPRIEFLALAFAVVLGLGSLILNFGTAEVYLFPPLFLLGAALPTIAVVAWASRGLGFPISWRQGSLALVSGSTLSIAVTLLLGGFLPFVAFMLIESLSTLTESVFGPFALGSPGLLERLFFSPFAAIFLLGVALQAPIPEEFAKALCLPMFGRSRIVLARQAFAIGLASGAGFAILENMLYEGLYAQWSGWTWGGVTALRAVGSVMHPLTTGIVALGWFHMQKEGVGRLLKAYLAAVLIHTLWNGGFDALVLMSGLDFYGGVGPTFSIYGETIEALLVAYLVALSIGLWLLLRRLVQDLGEDRRIGTVPAVVASRRVIAIWAFASAAVIIPIGAALTSAWPEIIELLISR